MIYITLVCNLGMSTSMLANKMDTYAKENNMDVDVIAMSDGAFQSADRKTDILLLGPQLSFAEKKMRADYGDKMKIAVVKTVDYGMMNGEKVIKDALALLEEE